MDSRRKQGAKEEKPAKHFARCGCVEDGSGGRGTTREKEANIAYCWTMEQWSNIAKLNEKATLNARVKLRLNPSMRRQGSTQGSLPRLQLQAYQGVTRTSLQRSNPWGLMASRITRPVQSYTPPISSDCKPQLFKRRILANSSINATIQRWVAAQVLAVLRFHWSLN